MALGRRGKTDPGSALNEYILVDVSPEARVYAEIAGSGICVFHSALDIGPVLEPARPRACFVSYNIGKPFLGAFLFGRGNG